MVEQVDPDIAWWLVECHGVVVRRQFPRAQEVMGRESRVGVAVAAEGGWLKVEVGRSLKGSYEGQEKERAIGLLFCSKEMFLKKLWKYSKRFVNPDNFS